MARIWRRARSGAVALLLGALIISSAPSMPLYVFAYCVILPFGGAVFSQCFSLARTLFDKKFPLRAEFMISVLRAIFAASWVIAPPIAGWLAAELGRQPWLVYGLQRTAHGTSPYAHGGDVAFTTLGYIGLYVVLGILFLYLIGRELQKGPQPPLSIPDGEEDDVPAAEPAAGG